MYVLVCAVGAHPQVGVVVGAALVVQACVQCCAFGASILTIVTFVLLCCLGASATSSNFCFLLLFSARGWDS